MKRSFSEKDVNQTESTADDSRILKKTSNLFRLGICPNIKIFGFTVEKQVPHTTAHHIGEIPSPMKPIEYLNRVLRNALA